MAWIDFSSTASDDWTEGPSDTVRTSSIVDSTDSGDAMALSIGLGFESRDPISLDNFEPIPGQENANITAVFPVQGDLIPAGGGGGPTRPTSGFLYPRGQG